jgi:hypothetical protein
MPGDTDDLLVRARSVLLDALTALAEHRDSVIVIGAQAIYLHTGAAPIAVAEATKDSDLAVDVRALRQNPLIDAAMEQAGFFLDPISRQPGAWMSPDGIPVDLMVPEAIAGGSSRRSAIHPPHDKRSMRRAVGLEAAVIDNVEMQVASLSPNDQRVLMATVAGPAALLVAKLHKIAERRETPNRLLDKDAHDIYRLLVTISTEQLADVLERLLSDDLAGDATTQAMAYLQELFAEGSGALGAQMVARAEEGVGDPEVAAQSSAVLAADLLTAIRI